MISRQHVNITNQSYQVLFVDRSPLSEKDESMNKQATMKGTTFFNPTQTCTYDVIVFALGTVGTRSHAAQSPISRGSKGFMVKLVG